MKNDCILHNVVVRFVVGISICIVILPMQLHFFFIPSSFLVCIVIFITECRLLQSLLLSLFVIPFALARHLSLTALTISMLM